VPLPDYYPTRFKSFGAFHPCFFFNLGVSAKEGGTERGKENSRSGTTTARQDLQTESCHTRFFGRCVSPSRTGLIEKKKKKEEKEKKEMLQPNLFCAPLIGLSSRGARRAPHHAFCQKKGKEGGPCPATFLYQEDPWWGEKKREKGKRARDSTRPENF